MKKKLVDKKSYENGALVECYFSDGSIKRTIKSEEYIKIPS